MQLKYLAIAVIFTAGCSGLHSEGLFPDQQSGRLTTSGSRTPMSATANVGYGITQFDWAYKNLKSNLFWLCNNGTEDSHCLANNSGPMPVTSFQAMESNGKIPCDAYAGYRGVCSAGTKVNDTMGSIDITHTLFVGPYSGDTSPTWVANYNIADENDTMTVSSSTLQNGTQVQIQELVSLTTGGVNCGGTYPGLVYYPNGSFVNSINYYVYSTFAPGNVFGACTNGSFVIKNSPSSTITNVVVGRSYPVHLSTYGFIYVWDTLDGTTLVQNTASMHDMKAAASIVPVTPAVTLSFASGGSNF